MCSNRKIGGARRAGVCLLGRVCTAARALAAPTASGGESPVSLRPCPVAGQLSQSARPAAVRQQLHPRTQPGLPGLSLVM
jgi:hypothetical protein